MTEHCIQQADFLPIIEQNLLIRLFVSVFSLNPPLDAFEAKALEALLPTILVAVKRSVTEKVHLLDKIKY